MYNDEKLYSVRSLVVVHIVNFQRDLVVMRFIRIELAKWIDLKYMYVMSHKQSALSLKCVYIVVHFT